MNIKQKFLKIQLRKTMGLVLLKLRKNHKKVIYSKIYLESKKKNLKSNKLRNNSLSKRLCLSQLKLLKVKVVYSIISLEVQAQLTVNLSQLNNLSLSKISTIRKQVKHLIKLLTRCLKMRNSRSKVRELLNQELAQLFNNNLE